MNRKGNIFFGAITFIAAIFFIILAVNFQTGGLSALAKTTNSISSAPENFYDLSKQAWGLLTAQNSSKILEASKKNTKTFLGFKSSGIGSFFYYLFLGLISGFWMWVYYTGHLWWEFLVEKAKSNRDEEELKESETRWLGFVSGKPWKIPLFAVAFAVIMQVPIINRILQIITLEIFGFKFLTRSLIIAIEVGFIPEAIENFRKNMIRIKLEKKVNKSYKGASITRATA